MSSSSGSILTRSVSMTTEDSVRGIPKPATISLPISGITVKFPFKPYGSQLAIMNQIIRALQKGTNAMIESPTGSGKSLALLCATLGWVEHQSRQRMERIAKLQEEYSEISNEISAEQERIASCYKTQGSSEPSDATDELLGPLNTSVSDKLLGSQPFTDNGKRRSPLTSGQAASLDDLDPGLLENLAEGAGARAGLPRSKDDIVIKDDSFEVIADEPKGSPKQAKGFEFINDDLKIKALQKRAQKIMKEIAKCRNMPKIYFSSRTHRQVAQLVKELKKNTPYRPRMSVLGSKSQYCILPEVVNSNSIDDACLKCREDESCEAYKRIAGLIKSPKFNRGGEFEVWDIEDMVREGKRVHACPYFASRDFAERAELVFCPYNYVIDPMIRKALEIHLKDSIVIIDEGHNIEDAAREAGSIELYDYVLEPIIMELRSLIKEGVMVDHHETIIDLLARILYWMRNPENTYRYYEDHQYYDMYPDLDFSSIKAKLDSQGITQKLVNEVWVAAEEVERDIVEKERMRKSEIRAGKKDNKRKKLVHLSNGSLRIVQGLLMVLRWVMGDSGHESDFRMVVFKKPNLIGASSSRSAGLRDKLTAYNNNCVYGFALWCMNPGLIFAEIGNKCHSVILTSGTLSPLDTYASELQTRFAAKLETSHVIPPMQFWAGAISSGPKGTRLEGKYSVVETNEYQDDIGEAICRLVDIVPDGMLVFIPSYSLINKLIKRWKQCGIYNRIAARKHIYIEPQHGPKANFELTLKGYCMKLDQPPPEDLSSTRDGCIMFAVYRGKVSEGIDFSDKYCRAVVNIGIPFPAYKDVKVKAKREYNDKRCTEGTLDNAISGGQWYEIQAYRAINQALGRCLRHKNDWGAIIFLESRFEMQNKVSQLSKWVRQHVRQFPLFEDALSSLSSYFAERKATYQAEMQQSNERAEKDTILIDLDLDDADSIITIAEEPAFDIDTEGHNDTPQDHSDLSAAARPITAITAPNLTHSSSVMQVDLLSSDDSDEGRGDARATFTTPIQTSRKASATNTEFYDCDYDYDLDVETGTQQWPAVACPDCKSPLLRPGYEGARIIRIDASYEIYPEMRAVHQSVRDICAPKDGSGSLDVVVVSQNHLANEFFRHQVRDFRPQFALNERCHKDVLTTEMIGCPFCFNDKSMLRNPQRRRLKRGTIFGLRILSYQQDPLAIAGADDLVAVYRPGDVWIPLGILTR